MPVNISFCTCIISFKMFNYENTTNPSISEFSLCFIGRLRLRPRLDWLILSLCGIIYSHKPF